jgi:type IV pilus assembly protein PilF
MKIARSVSEQRRPWSLLSRWALAAVVTGLLSACVTSSSSGGSGGNTPSALRTDSDQTDADRRAGVRMELAAGYFARGQYSTALDEVKLALAAKPNMREAINLRGLIYAAMGEPQLAEDNFKRALLMFPGDSDTLHNYGWMLCQQQRWAEADAQFDLALTQPGYRAPARTMMAKGVCEARSGRMAAAERSLAKAFEFDPASPAVAVNLAEVLYRNNELERARFYVRRVNALAEQSNAQTLWLELRVERRLGHGVAVDDLSQQLRRRYAQSPETQALNAGRFDE